MERKHAADYDPDLLKLYDAYVHGAIGRRDFIDTASRYAVAGLTAAAILESLSPNYAWAQQVARDDSRLTAEYVPYESPAGQGKMRGYLVRPVTPAGRRPGVVVVHENRGLNPYIEDVTRRVAVAGYVAFAPDALTPVGGYPGNDDQGRELQAKLDSTKVVEDFMAAVAFLKTHPACTGTVGIVGFCFGGRVANAAAVRIPDLAAAVPFYGSQPQAADVAKIKAPLLIHYAGLDERVNAGWPAYEAALKEHKVSYTMHMYEGVNHGFHNDTTPRYDKAAATLAWERTLAFFETHLK